MFLVVAAEAPSPEGTRLVLQSSRSGTAQSWLNSTDGDHPIQLTNMGRHSAPPRGKEFSRRRRRFSICPSEPAVTKQMAQRVCEIDADFPRKETDFDDRDPILGHLFQLR